MDRQLSTITYEYGLGRVHMDFSFQTNAGSSPLLSTVVGLTSGTAGAGQAPPPVLTSLTRTGAGVIVVQFSQRETFNKVLTVFADLDDTTFNDGAYCSVRNVTNEGSSTAGIAFTITTRAAATAAATDYANRIIRCSVTFRNTAAGQ